MPSRLSRGKVRCRESTVTTQPIWLSRASAFTSRCWALTRKSDDTTLASCLLPATRRRAVGPGSCYSGSRAGNVSGDGRVSQVPERPSCPCALFLDPGRTEHARPLRRVDAAPACVYNGGSRKGVFRGSIARHWDSLSTLRREGRPSPRKTRFRLLAKLCRAGFVNPQGRDERFLCSSHFLLSRAFLTQDLHVLSLSSGLRLVVWEGAEIQFPQVFSLTADCNRSRRCGRRPRCRDPFITRVPGPWGTTSSSATRSSTRPRPTPCARRWSRRPDSLLDRPP